MSPEEKAQLTVLLLQLVIAAGCPAGFAALDEIYDFVEGIILRKREAAKASTGSITWTTEVIERGGQFFVRLSFDGQPDLFLEERGPFADQTFASGTAHELSLFVGEQIRHRLSQIRTVILPRRPSGANPGTLLP